MPSSSASSGPRPLPSLIFLTGLNLFNYLDRFILAAILGPLQADMHLSDGAAGRLVTAFMLGYFVTSPFFGYLGDRFPRKWLVAGGVFVWSLGTVLSGLSPTYGALIACRLLIGLGEASYATLAPGWLADLYPSEKRNNALTIFYVAIPIGSALGYLLGSWVEHAYGWRWAFGVAGAPGLVLALLLLFQNEPVRGAMDRAAPSGGQPPSKLPAWRDMLGLFRIGDYNLTLLGYTAYTFALGAFGVWGPTFLVRMHGMANHKADTFFGAVLVVAGLLGTLLGGFAASAWQRRNRAGYALTLGLSVAAGVPLAAAAFMVPGATASMVFLGLAMFALFLPTGPINTLLLESVPATLRASAMAVSIFVIHLFGDFWSPEIVGRLADWWGSLGRAVLVLPVALALAAVFWLWLAAKHLAANRRVPTAAP